MLLKKHVHVFEAKCKEESLNGGRRVCRPLFD